MFRKNVGGIDRALRVTLGTILIFAGLFLLAERNGIGLLVTAIGLIVFATGILKFCGLYMPFGISTAQPEIQVGLGKRMCCGTSMDEMQSSCCVGEPAASSEKEAGGTVVTTDEQR